MKNYKKSIFLLGTIVLLILFIVFGSEKVPQYKTISIQTGDVLKEVDFSSQWYPVGYTKVSLGSYSDIRKINVKEGSNVKKGQIIAELNNDQEYNQYKTLQASMSAAYYNKKNLEKNPLATDEAIKAAQQQINSASYQMKNAEIQMNKRKLTAPISGRVVSINVSEYSSNITASASILSASSSTSSNGNSIVIADVKNPSFKALVSEREIARLAKDMKVTVKGRIEDGYYTGVIDYVSKVPNTEADESQYEIIVKLDKYPSNLPYGAKFEGSVIVLEKRGVKILPYDAITIDSSTDGAILVYNGSSVESRKVKLGVIGDDSIEVIEGVSDNEQIVLDQLADKKIITVRPWLKKIFTNK